MGQDILDITIILILFFFTIRGYFNGLVGEVAAIVSLVGGFVVAHKFHPLLAPYLDFIAEPMWRTMAAYVVLFVAVVIGVALLARLVQRLLSLAFATWADRLGGGFFGLAKGILVCSLIFLVLGKFFSTADFYKNSRVRPYMTAVIEQLRTSLPPDIVKKFSL
ncbi:MAG TPA: CvpA family protein [Candidatus Desulfovibrio intestinipullorum]|uniref:CvpA family protein n=1 Tax=Candidatus Desulfovibrio intestinipullorum TaxID=2838536 RepID=A0A9D1TQL4_9BACT|nr:CvpA family protein [Candidatus Desulfovibrio intestinipullorum]